MAQLGNVNSWAGEDRPREPLFQNLPTEEARAVVGEALNNAFGPTELRSLSSLRNYSQVSLAPYFNGNQQGIYRACITPHDQLPNTMIVHVKPRASEETMSFGAKVFKHLNRNDVSAADYIETSNGDYVQLVGGGGDDYAVYFTTHVAGAHPSSNAADLQAFGKTIAGLELALTQLPINMQEIILENSGDRYALWHEGFAHFQAKGTRYAEAHPDVDKVLQFCADFLRIKGGIPLVLDGGPSHFDLIESNALIYTNADGKAAGHILDCDTLRSGWAPAHYDLGTLAFRVGANMPVASGSEKMPPLTAETLEPLRLGYNQASGITMDQPTFLDHAMNAAALVMMVIPALDSRNQDKPVSVELVHHTRKMTEKVAGMIEIYRNFRP